VNNSILAALLSAIPELRDLIQVMTLLLPQLLRLAAAIQGFRQRPPTPASTCAFENDLAAIVRDANRIIVAHEYNHIEPQCLDDCPFRLRFAGEEYRRRPKSRMALTSPEPL
jgi:hypothetical protein